MASRFTCLHFVRELRAELGGVVKAAIDLSQSMADLGHRVILATFDATDAPKPRQRPDRNSVETVELAPSRVARPLLSRAALVQMTDLARQADVAHLHTPWEFANLQLASLFRRERTPYIVSVHGMLDHYCMHHKAGKKRAFLALGGRKLFSHASAIHFTARSEMEQALAYIPGADRAAIEPCAMDLLPYSSLPGIEVALTAYPQIRRDARKILFLSRVHPKKGVDLLIRAVAKLQTSHDDLQLLIAGPGDDQYIGQLKTLAAELGIGNLTHFLGMVHGVQQRSLYQAADVFVLPTHQENFGLVLPEAMACGTPVVTTRGTDIWQELQQGGAWIADHDPQSIAAAITEVLGDSAAARLRGEQGRALVLQWLDRNHVAAKYESLYRKTIARGIPPFNVAAIQQEQTVGAR